MLKVGDMVMLLRVDNPIALKMGVLPGAYGTLTEHHASTCGCGQDWVLTLQGFAGKFGAQAINLRKIEPPERGDWQFCVWKPSASVH